MTDLIDEVDDNRTGALEFPEFVQLISNLRNGQAGLLGRFLQNSKQSSIIRKEFEDYFTNGINDKFTFHLNGSVRKWIVQYKGPENTPYQNGLFNLEIE